MDLPEVKASKIELSEGTSIEISKEMPELPKIDKTQLFMDWFGSSTLAYQLAKKFPSDEPIPEDRVSSELEKRWEKAQEAAGILPCFRLPVRYGLKKENEFASVLSGRYMHLTIKKSTEESHGWIQYALNHEAQHVKYNDGVMNFFPTAASATTFYSGFALLSYKIKKVKTTQAKIAFVEALGIATLVATSLSVERYFGNKLKQKTCERRADIQGAYATRCFTCVDECAQEIKKDEQNCQQQLASINKSDNPESPENKKLKNRCKKSLEIRAGGNSPYLSSKELASIARDLERQGLICDYHKQEQKPQQSFLRQLFYKLKKI